MGRDRWSGLGVIGAFLACLPCGTPAAEGDLADLDCAFGDDEEPAARLALLEEEPTWAEHARGASRGQAMELSHRGRLMYLQVVI